MLRNAFVAQKYESSFFWNLEHVPEFRTSFGNESKLKFSNGRIYDDLKLSNKGKMKKAKAEFHHRNAGDSSGEFLTKFNLGLTFELKTTIKL